MSAKWRLRLAVVLLASLAAMGCNPLILLSTLVNGNEVPKTPPKCPLKPWNGHEKDPVRVLVLVKSSPRLAPEFMPVESALTSEISRTLRALADENKDKITMLPATKIAEYKKENPRWFEDPVEFGRSLDAHYVIFVEVNQYTLDVPGSPGQDLLQGQAGLSVNAYDLSKKEGEPIFETEINYQMPQQMEAPSRAVYRKKFTETLAKQVARIFVAHRGVNRLDD